MFEGFLEAIGVIASLIGIWEFVSRRAFARKFASTLSRFTQKTLAIHRNHVYPCVARRVTPFDPAAPANTNRYPLAGSYRSKTQILPGNHDVDIVALLK